MPVVGFLLVTLFMEANSSLKDKRRVVKSVLTRVRSRFNASCSEVDSQDDRSEAVLGFSVCGPDTRILRRVLSRILDFVEENADAEVVDYEMHCPLTPEELDIMGLEYPPSGPEGRRRGDDPGLDQVINWPEVDEIDEESPARYDRPPAGGPDEADGGDGDDEPTPPGILKFKPGPRPKDR